MKVNEAPEKIYLVRTTRIIDEWRQKPSQYAHNIEYTRTDVFIEKACEWLEGHIYEYLKTNRTWNEPDYDPKLIGDFRNYLKGK